MSLNHDGITKEYFLVVYKALSGSICLFIETNQKLTDELYTELHGFIGPQLTSISSEISDNYINEQQTIDNDSGPKYLYFNELNCQHQGTIHLNNRFIKNKTISSDMMNILIDLFDNRNKNDTNEETIVKTMSGYWIVKRSGNSRHFFVIVNKNSTLPDIADETKKMCEQHVKNVFFDKN